MPRVLRRLPETAPLAARVEALEARMDQLTRIIEASMALNNRQTQAIYETLQLLARKLESRR